jgi:hypothetical protein
MATERLSMRKIREILRLKWAVGRSHREVAASLGVSVGAVSAAEQRARGAGLDWITVETLDDDTLEARLYGATVAERRRPFPDPVWIHTERKKPGVTLELLHHEYLERHPGGYAYTQFCERYRRWCEDRRLSMRQVHRAGEKLFVDFAGQRPSIVDPTTGEVRDVELFVAVLGASNYTYAEATATQQIGDWIQAHVRAFDFLGGIPGAVVSDYVARHIIGVMCPPRLCGIGRRTAPGSRRFASARQHNHQSELSQASRDSSLRQTGCRGNSAVEASPGGSQARSAASLVRVLISA